MAYKQRVNGDIKATNVRLILPDGKMHGDISIHEARKIALDLSLDLVEVSPISNGSLPVCKALDYGKLKYQKNKKKQHHSHQDVKEVRVSVNISDHDLDRKKRQVLKFLQQHHKVKYTLELKGRRRREDINQVLSDFTEQLGFFDGKGQWNDPNVSHKSVSVMLVPV